MALKENLGKIETAEIFTGRKIHHDKIIIKGTGENLEKILSGIYQQLNNIGILLIN